MTSYEDESSDEEAIMDPVFITMSYHATSDLRHLVPNIHVCSAERLLTSDEWGLVLHRRPSDDPFSDGPFQWKVMRKEVRETHNNERTHYAMVFVDDTMDRIPMVSGESFDAGTHAKLKDMISSWPDDDQWHTQHDIAARGIVMPRPTWDNPKDIGEALILEQVRTRLGRQANP